MSPVRIIQTFVRVCADCPNCTYYSGGMYRCSLTDEMIRPDDKPYTVGDRCPLPYAGPPVIATPAVELNLRAIADAAQAYVDAVNGEPEKDCWDTEDGKEAPGALRFASDWAWQEYDVKKQKAFDALRAALAAEGPQQ